MMNDEKKREKFCGIEEGRVRTFGKRGMKNEVFSHGLISYLFTRNDSRGLIVFLKMY